MAYIKTIWENSPSVATPINDTNLNKLEQGVFDSVEKVVGKDLSTNDYDDLAELEVAKVTDKADQTDVDLKEDITIFTTDTTSTTPTKTLVHNNEYIFSDDAITTLGITLSSGYSAGFIASVVFISPASAPTVTLTNTGAYTIKDKGDGSWSSLVFTPTVSTTVTMIFNYDGINMNVYVSEL